MPLIMDDLWTPAQTLPSGAVLMEMARRCGRAWEMDDLDRRVRIIYSARLRTTLGRAHLEKGLVELNIRLLREHPAELVATVVHELAHVAVYLRYGRVAPHGLEFHALMRAVNHSAKATHRLSVQHLRRRRGRYLYLHRCPTCGQTFIARRVRRDCFCRSCGPPTRWNVLRAAATQEGLQLLRSHGRQSIG